LDSEMKNNQELHINELDSQFKERLTTDNKLKTQKLDHGEIELLEFDEEFKKRLGTAM